MQRRFLRKLNFSEVAALNEFHLAPLVAQRDMAMLGALHKITLGIAPAQLMALFPPLPAPLSGTGARAFDRQRLRHWRPPHDCQLHTEAHFQSSDVLLGSLFCFVKCYNKLPQHAAAARNVKDFQRLLQNGFRKHANNEMTQWQPLFCSGWKRMLI